jgi:hypothetical protein
MSTVDRHLGYVHSWDRVVSRREFVGAAGGALTAVLGASLWVPALAQMAPASAPKPIPGGFTPPFTSRFIHHFLPGRGKEPSQITDFKGFVALAKVSGSGTGTDKKTGATSRLLFEIDNRFMKGTYVGMDGQQYTGTYGFF